MSLCATATASTCAACDPRRGLRRARRGPPGGGAREHDHHPRPAAPAQPRRRARDRGGGARARAPCPATIALVDGEVRIGLDDAALEAIAAGRRRRRSAACATSRRSLARGGTRRDDGRRHLARSPCAPGSACSPPAASAACTARRARPGTSRPTSATLAPDADHRRLRGREVDPRRRRHARAAGDAERHRARLRHRRFPGFYLADSGFPVPWRVDTPDEVAGGRCARARSSAPRRRSSSPTRCPRTSSSTRSCTTACSRRPARRPPSRASRGKDVDAVPARLLPPRDRRREPRGERPARAAQRRAGGADRARRGMTHRRRRRPDGRRASPRSPGRSRTAATRRRRSRSPAAARAPTSPRGWRAPARTVAFVGRVGDDARGARRSPRCDGRRRCTSTRDPERADRHLHRARAPRRRAHDAPRRGRQRRARAADELPAGGAPAPRRLRAAARGLARERRCAALARARAARDDRLRRPLLGGAARRGPAFLDRARRSTCCCPTPTRRGAGARAAASRARSSSSSARRARSGATAARRRARRPTRSRSSTPPAPATRSPPGFLGARLAAPSRREALAAGCALAARAVAQRRRPASYD